MSDPVDVEKLTDLIIDVWEEGEGETMSAPHRATMKRLILAALREQGERIRALEAERDDYKAALKNGATKALLQRARNAEYLHQKAEARLREAGAREAGANERLRVAAIERSKVEARTCLEPGCSERAAPYCARHRGDWNDAALRPPDAPTPTCPRCGADFLPDGRCSQWLIGCQGGRGEAARPPDARPAEPPKYDESAEPVWKKLAALADDVPPEAWERPTEPPADPPKEKVCDLCRRGDKPFESGGVWLHEFWTHERRYSMNISCAAPPADEGPCPCGRPDRNHTHLREGR